MSAAEEIIAKLALSPHPEGGHFRETWRDPPRADYAPCGNPRGLGTAIFFLLQQGQRSVWHRVDGVEIWHFYAGDPLALNINRNGELKSEILGPDILAGENPQIMVPANAWQSAESLGDWTLVGCTVTPAFTYDGFEMAPKGWSPGRG